jgi:uncharacterized membrane protein YfcA
MEFLLPYLATGAVAGFLAGLLGVGGGLVIVPVLALVFAAQGFPAAHVMHFALGTSLTSILFTSLSSVRAHHAHGAVEWAVVRGIAPGIVTGTLLGTWLAAQLPTQFLKVFFIVFIYYVAAQMLLNIKPKGNAEEMSEADAVQGARRAATETYRRDRRGSEHRATPQCAAAAIYSAFPKPSRRLPGRAGLFAAGGVIGGVSSLVGIGGGTLSVPFLSWCNVSLHRAIATSAAIGFPIAAAGALGFLLNGLAAENLPPWSLGYISLPALGGLALASVLTAPLGARVAHRLPVARLKKVFALLLLALGTRMLMSL